MLVGISMCAMAFVDTHWSSRNRVKCRAGYVLNTLFGVHTRRRWYGERTGGCWFIGRDVNWEDRVSLSQRMGWEPKKHYWHCCVGRSNKGLKLRSCHTAELWPPVLPYVKNIIMVFRVSTWYAVDQNDIFPVFDVLSGRITQSAAVIDSSSSFLFFLSWN